MVFNDPIWGIALFLGAIVLGFVLINRDIVFKKK